MNQRKRRNLIGSAPSDSPYPHARCRRPSCTRRRGGAGLRNATILDITPTVLHALGVPLSHDLPGHPLRDAWVDGPRGDEPARTTKYEFVPVPPPDAAAAEAPAKIAELRALGYLTGASDSARPADGRFAASYLNEGVALYVDGEQRDALRAFARAAELDPQNVNARAFAARIHLERREYTQAEPLLDRAAALDPRSAYVRLLRANLAIGTAQWDAAERELAAAEALDRHLPMLYIQRARLLDARGDPAAALVALKASEALTDAATRLGRTAEADAALQRASELASPERIAVARSDVALARSDAGAALRYVRAALDRNPNSARLWTVLGAASGLLGELERAMEAYEHSVALEPTALACKTLAALVFEVRHDRARAVALWQQSLQLDKNQPDVTRFLQQFGDGQADPRR